MLRLAFIFTFIVSIAAATFGVLMTNNMRRKHVGQPLFSTLLYQQIFVFIFVMYGIWGFIFFKLIFSTEFISKSLLEKISSLQTLIVIPFQLLSWWFLIQLIMELVHIKKSRWVSMLLLLGIFVFIFPIYLLFFNHAESVHRNVFSLYCILNGLIYSLIFILLLSFKSSFLSQKRKFWVALVILSIGLVLSVGSFIYAYHILLTLLVILSFFILNLWPVVLFQRLVFIQPEVEQVEFQNFESLCNRYEISKREAEIIQLICQGLPNKAIADQLFITLQTVKDHTSRIYIKTEVQNRTQLANLFRG